MDRETDKKRPMIFSNDKAFKQLKENGYVVTFRTKKVKKGPLWIRRSRTGPKEFDAEVTKWARTRGVEASINEKGPFSGFSSAKEWLKAIVGYHGSIQIKKGYFITVERPDRPEEVIGNSFEKAYGKELRGAVDAKLD